MLPGIPRSSRLTIRSASLIVPKPMREEWQREWHAELWHRAESGASEFDLWRCARGSFRDAIWFRSSDYVQAHLASEGFLVKPLRPELALLAVAIIFCLVTGAFVDVRLPSPNARHLVRFEHNLRILGGRDVVLPIELLKSSRKIKEFSDIAFYRSPRNTDSPDLGVSANFFDVVGVKPALGRTFRAGEHDPVVVITDDYWRIRLHRDPRVLQRTIKFAGEPYSIIGVLPRGFRFPSLPIRIYTPLSPDANFAGAIALLKPGANLQAAASELHDIVLKSKQPWIGSALQLVPMWTDPRKDDAIISIVISIAGALCGVLFLIFKGLVLECHGGARYRLLLAARLFTMLLAFSGIRLALTRLFPGTHDPISFAQFWLFAMVCCAAIFLVVRDHCNRCLICLRPMRMPVPIGTWSSALLDQPATEYVCPAGHGTLYIAETENAPDHWTVLDDSWQNLFVHR